jgi:clan AA aspartic protease
MNGWVDSAGRALVRIRLTSVATATSMEAEAWIDTGFTGELVLPQDQIAALGLPHSAVVTAELGDGSATMLEAYSCLIEWFGRAQQVEVIANTGTSPLLGVGLLQGHRLTIDYAARTLTIE